MSATGRGRRRREISGSLARVYQNANQERPREYWDYEALTVEWGCVVALATDRSARSAR